jgi:hypothetical protein
MGARSAGGQQGHPRSISLGSRAPRARAWPWLQGRDAIEHLRSSGDIVGASHNTRCALPGGYPRGSFGAHATFASSEVTGWASPANRATVRDRRDWYRRRISAHAESAISRLRPGAEQRARTTGIAIQPPVSIRHVGSARGMRTHVALGSMTRAPNRRFSDTLVIHPVQDIGASVSA